MGELMFSEEEGAAILESILRSGMPAKAVAAKMDVTSAAVSGWKKKYAVPHYRIPKLLDLAHSLDIDIYLAVYARLISKRVELPGQKKRKDAAQQLLRREVIDSMTVIEWVRFLESLETSGETLWDQNDFWKKNIGDVLSAKVCAALQGFIADGEEGLTATDFTHMKSQLPDVGMGLLSEILSLRFPGRYWTVSSKTLEYLDRIGVDLDAEIPRGKRGDVGEKYMAAGQYLNEVRVRLTAEAGRDVDFLETEQFIRWVVGQKRSDPWEGRVREIIREYLNSERLATRRDGEAKASYLLKEHLGQMTKQSVEQFFRNLNLDRPSYSVVENRFAITTIGQNQKLMQSELKIFNSWTERIWRADDDEVFNVLDAFWRANDLPGAGTTFPTMILYLRDPERYTIWLPVASSALELVGELSPGRFRTSEGYARFNEAARRFRDRYAIPPEALDLVLSVIGKKSDVDEPKPASQPDEEQRYTLDQLIADTFLDKEFWSVVTALLDDKPQIIFYGPPGTGKTWVARQFARHFVELGQSEEENPGPGEVAIVQLHPSYAYEEFVEGIRPVMVDRPGGGRDMSYEVRDGVFKQFCRKAAADPVRRYVLILDEINRADVARVFGELLYLLEYRGEFATLPYSGEKFHVPKNLYIIATMNSADRSIALIDLALRRRFHFRKLEPSVDALRSYHERHDTKMSWTADLLRVLNQQLTADDRDWEYHIGHSHFMSRSLNEQRLRYIWDYTIMPTLEEYFHKDQTRLEAYALDVLRKLSESTEES